MLSRLDEMAGGSSRDPSQLINHTTESIVGDVDAIGAFSFIN